MMTSTSLFLVAVMCSAMSVHGQNSTNSTSGLSFRGPGYLACDIVEYEAMPCSNTLDYVNCTADQIMQECNTSALVGTTDISFTTFYLPLQCDCVVAVGCPTSCEQFSGDVPTLPPSGSNSNFAGVGSVTCPLSYLCSLDEDACYPTVIDSSTCGTCDFEAALTFDDDFFGYMDGDTNVTIPLPCECIVLLGCPDTCTFVATGAAPTTEETPVAAPVRSPMASAPSTSAGFATTIHSYKYAAVMTVLVLVSVVIF